MDSLLFYVSMPCDCLTHHYLFCLFLSLCLCVNKRINFPNQAQHDGLLEAVVYTSCHISFIVFSSHLTLTNTTSF